MNFKSKNIKEQKKTNFCKCQEKDFCGKCRTVQKVQAEGTPLKIFKMR